MSAFISSIRRKICAWRRVSSSWSPLASSSLGRCGCRMDTVNGATDVSLWLLLGVAAALPYVAHARRHPRHQRRIYAVGLVVAALIYVAFAVVAGNVRAIGIELGGTVLFSLLAWIGLRLEPYVLAAGWAGHVAWDLLVHSIETSGYAPWWYAAACIGFDLFVAGFIAGTPRTSWTG